ncbi:acyl-homoserine-lactone synthase [Profundibacter sp.]
MEIVIGGICDNSGINSHINGFLRLRRKVFIDGMDWKLISHNQIEYEQYDTIATTYVIAHEHGKVIGGARLLRTDSKLPTSFGLTQYSYMIRDAYLGLLPGLPSNICYAEPPANSKTWELTRFVSLGSAQVGREILTTVNDYIKFHNAETCLFLAPPVFMRMSKSMGYTPKPIGKIVGNETGRFLAFSCNVI